MELKIGDIVHLNSDVNVIVMMTINGYSSYYENFFVCCWFEGKEIKSSEFHRDALTKID